MSSVPRQRLLFGRRLALLASAAALGAALVFVGPGFDPAITSFANAETAPTPQRPVGFADIVAKVKPAVISVRVKMDVGAQSSGLGDEDNPFGPSSPFRFFFRRFGENGPPDLRDQFPRHQFATGQGSGFFISADGYAVTNNHVVAKAASVEVTTDDGKTHNAKVIGTDPRTDLALIKVDGDNFPFVQLADQTPRIGDWVLAVGNPFGLGGTVTAGIVSARGRDIGAGPYDDFIQIDAPVNKGNSGGPAFDVDGRVIGVNTAIFSPSGGSVGIAFAIPSETVKTVINQLRENGKVTRGWIGVQIQPVTADIADSLGMKDPHGALVAEPQEHSPAAKAGIKSGDVIVSLDGRPVPDARTLARRISAMAPGTAVKIGVFRNGKEEQLSMTLGELPKEVTARKTDQDHNSDQGTNIPRLGLSLAPAANVSGAGTQGVVVTQVDPDGAAAAQGFRTGDVILDVGGETVNAPSDVRRAIEDAKAGGKHTVLMRVKSDQGTHFVAVPLGNA
ncbi:MAG TPA: Do family serine endopeptidase [Xanthobacteraceae bacterium]|nr:Do family serine endopeptidase [Xanthobacteraceae bacterium]